jgi:hypothetical protein
MINANLYRQGLNPADRALACLKVLHIAQTEMKETFTLPEATGLLQTRLDCSEPEALMYLRISQLDPRVLAILSRKMISAESADKIALRTENVQDSSSRGDMQFEIAKKLVAKSDSIEAIIKAVVGDDATDPSLADKGDTARKKPQKFKTEIPTARSRIRISSGQTLSTQEQISELELAIENLRRQL